jgi:hypothetical protein
MGLPVNCRLILRGAQSVMRKEEEDEVEAAPTRCVFGS